MTRERLAEIVSHMLENRIATTLPPFGCAAEIRNDDVVVFIEWDGSHEVFLTDPQSVLK